MNDKFLPSKVIIAVAVLSLLALSIIHYYQLDFYLADLIYNAHGEFIYKDNWVTSELLHRYVRLLIIGLYLIFALRIIRENKGKETFYQYMVLLFSILAGAIVIAVLKKLLSVDCPWNLLRYGGTKPFFSLFHYDSQFLPSYHCFPAAHAGLGFTFISVYFYCSIFVKKYQYWALFASLITGFSFGFLQQLRGAHFLSHDITSLLICIIINFIIYRLAFKKRLHL